MTQPHLILARIAVTVLTLLFSRPALAANFAFAELEGGALYQSRNDAAVPGDTGTRFSLRDVLSSPIPVFRLYAGYSWADRHTIRALWAPLSTSDTGQLNIPVSFQGRTFNNTDPTRVEYKFNSYRLTYRYDFVRNWVWDGGVGLTFKIRDAKISLSQNGVTETKSNVGPVPLIHFRFAFRPTYKLEFELDGDALAAPQGRAEDISLKVRYWAFPEALAAFVGYRTLEGGADNEEVYSFAWFHYIVGGVTFRI